MRIYRLIAQVLIIFISGCSYISTNSFQIKNSDCLIDDSCSHSGNLTIHINSNSAVGIMDYESSCIPLALPDFVVKEPKEWDGEVVKIIAKTYSTHQDGGVLSYKVNDRWVMAGICEVGTVLYVTDISINKK